MALSTLSLLMLAGVAGLSLQPVGKTSPKELVVVAPSKLPFTTRLAACGGPESKQTQSTTRMSDRKGLRLILNLMEAPGKNFGLLAPLDEVEHPLLAL